MKYLGENSALSLITKIKTWVNGLVSDLQTAISAKPSINDSASSTQTVYSSNKVNGLLQSKADSTALSTTNSNLSSLQNKVDGLGLVATKSAGVSSEQTKYIFSGVNYSGDNYTIVLTVASSISQTQFEAMCEAKPMINSVKYTNGNTAVTVKCMGGAPSTGFPMMIYVYKTK